MANKLLDKLRKNSTIKEAEILSESKFFNDKDVVTTPVPMINAALSGDIDGGLSPGLLVLAGPSKHFKTAFSLLMAHSYMAKYPDAVILFYDSEFGTPESYFNSFGLTGDKIWHAPITDIEKLKFDIMSQLNGLERGDRVIIIVDSLGNLASKKEVEDALKESSAADMTRARSIKSLFRMVTPHLTIKDIPMVVVNHIYMTQEMYSKPVVSGGTGVMLSADNVWILGRQQDKDDDGLNGYHFIVNIEKSRHVKEKTKIPITVTFKGGIAMWSGLLDIAVEAGYIHKPKVGWYEEINPETGEVISEKMYRAKDIENNGTYWKDMLARTTFKQWIKERFSLGQVKMVSEDAPGAEMSKLEEDE